MARISYYIFGYRLIEIAPEKLSDITSILLRGSIPSVINNDGTIKVMERDFDKTLNLISGRTEFAYSKPLGLYGMWKLLPYKVATIVTLLISVAITVILSRTVWDIRVEGNEDITDSEIIIGLSACGFETGNFWHSINKSAVETSFLEYNDKISWININRRGTVAYVKVLEKENNEENNAEEGKAFYNIVAHCDCVIEEMTVKQGTPVVKVGDTVRKGDVLVVGILPPTAGGGFCSAEAIIVGRINDRVSIEIDRVGEKKINSNRKLYSLTIKILKFSLNIFKMYGNLTNDCDIIENEIAYSLLGRCKLPISVKSVYIIENESATVTFSDEELVSMGMSRLNSLTVSRLEGSDLLKIKTTGKFTDRGYLASSEIIFLAEVGERVEFSTD